KLVSALSFLGILVFLKFTGLIVPNLPYLTAKASWEYILEQRKMAQFDIGEPIGNFKNVAHNSPAEKNIYVLILGESTTKNHFGIYGYPRKTTPKLNEIKNELLIYR